MPKIERLLHGLGRAGPIMHAVSGLDIALWDIRGKLEGVSVSKLLGGAKRKRVETYASLLQYSGNVEHVKRNTARALERGYKHIKLHERTAEAVAAARGVTGPGIPIMVDTNCAWTPAQAEGPVAAMAPSKPHWVEEPIWPPEDFEVAGQSPQGHWRAAGDGRKRHQPFRFPQDDRGWRDRFRAALASSRSAASPICRGSPTEVRKSRRAVCAACILFWARLAGNPALHRLQGSRRSAGAAVRGRRLDRLFEHSPGSQRRGRGAGRSRPRRRSRRGHDRKISRLIRLPR